MPDELEERLLSHARAFDGLLSLIPAKLYYGEDVSDQWQRKKQTPEQKRAAKMAKLDPDNMKTAKDVMDERAAAAALKRKREEPEDVVSDVGGEVSEKPKEGLLKKDVRKAKKRKIADDAEPKSKDTQNGDKEETQDTEEQKKRRKAEQKAAKRERKQAKAMKMKEKRDRQKAKKQDAVSNEPKTRNADESEEVEEDDQSEDDTEMAEAIDIGNGFSTVLEAIEASSASPSPVAESPILSPHSHSGSSSISSIVPPTNLAPKKPSLLEIQPPSKPTNDGETALSVQERIEARERLQAAIDEKRAARKADGPDGRAPRNRQELLESRRKKEEERRTLKKEQRRKAKEEEARKQDEEIARRFSPGGSGSLLASPRSPMEPVNNFSFGRVAFGDGTQTDATLSSMTEHRKHKGPADPATALKAAQSKKSRLSGLDEDKRANIEEKDMWLNAKKRAHGERVRDDTSLLKKALKRQESTKKKSEKEWSERIEGVAKGQHMRQKKRDDNLRKRSEEKGGKGKKGKSKKVKRPGFEGSFKGRTGGGGSGGGKKK